MHNRNFTMRTNEAFAAPDIHYRLVKIPVAGQPMAGKHRSTTRATFIAPNLYPDELTTSEGYAGGARKQILVKKGMPATLWLPLPGMRVHFRRRLLGTGQRLHPCPSYKAVAYRG